MNIKDLTSHQECIAAGKISATESYFGLETLFAPPQKMYGNTLPSFQP